MRRTSVLVIGVVAVFLCPRAASAQNKVEQQMFVEIRQLQELHSKLLQAVNTALDQLKTVSTKIDSEANARVKGFADQQLLINANSSAVSALSERVSENKVQAQKVTQELDAVKKGVDMLTVMVTQALSQLPAAPAPTDPNALPGSSPPPSSVPAAGGVPASSEDYFARAMADYAVGQWDLAIQGFQEYLKRFPDGPMNAKVQRTIGEAYFFWGKYPDAVAAYEQVVQKYKGSEEIPDAIYKQGVAYEQMKQKEKAIEAYKLVRKDYPASTAALQATQDLKRLAPNEIK